jgi:hypothetical protein
MREMDLRLMRHGEDEWRDREWMRGAPQARATVNTTWVPIQKLTCLRVACLCLNSGW